MGLESLLKVVRLGGGGAQEVKVTGERHGGLHVAQSLPPYAELTRQGGGYQAMATAAVAALVVRPSTTAMATLWNGEPDGGLSYIIDRAFAHWLVSTAAQTYAGLWLCVHPTGMAAPTADITAIKSLSGKTGYGGRARFDNGATVLDDGWFPYGTQVDTSATGVLPGAATIALVEGRIIVPPSAGLSIHVVSGVVGDTFTAGFAWYEAQLDLD